MLSNREMLHFLIRKNFCGVNLGLDSEGIAMSGSIGQAMRYTVTFSQCPAFEIYKRLSVFSERITVREADACRSAVPVISLNTKKKILIKVHCASRQFHITFQHSMYSMAAYIYMHLVYCK